MYKDGRKMPKRLEKKKAFNNDEVFITHQLKLFSLSIVHCACFYGQQAQISVTYVMQPLN
jgi:hypothetical protein